MKWIADSYWLVPAVYVVVSLVLVGVLARWDEEDPVELTRSIDAGSASAALSALAAGMIAFTGFVTSVVLLVIQFGSSEFSPRLLRWFRRDRTLKYALSTFVATFLFALVATVEVGRGTEDFVPTRTLLAALGLTLLSVAMFLVLIDRTANGLRVANVAQRIDSAARKVFDSVYPASPSEAEVALQTAHALGDAPPVQIVRNGAVGAVLVTLDRDRLAWIAHRGNAVIELVHAVGDHVPAGAALANVHGPSALPERPLRRALVLGDERTIDDDPAFAIRILVDVAIKGLSPAVNDPTTAVQNLGRIEDLLRYAAPKHLSVGVVADSNGVARLIYPTPTWEDLVELALTEIRAFGAGQYQIARRLRALLEALLVDLPERRHPPLLIQLELLDDAVDRAFPASQRAASLVADRQGLGMSRRGTPPGRDLVS
jgi:uncharacterized membrane protein